MANELYPVFLKVHKLHILIVGGGHVALEKLTFLFKSSPNARVTLIAPAILPEIKTFATEGKRITLVERRFLEEDLVGVQLAVIATENRVCNQKIRNKAKARGILINVADTPALCDFYMGSIITKGDLKIGISTNGQSPTIAKRLKEFLDDIIPEAIDPLLQNMRKVRDRLKGDFQNKVRKLDQITADLVSSESEVF